PPVSEPPPEELYPVRAYSPWKTLRPHFWLPFVATDALGNTAGAFTAGFDAAFRHEYTAAAWWAIDSRQPGWDLSYTNHTQYADLNFGTFRDVEVPDGAGFGYTERVLQGTLTATFPFTQVEHAQFFSVEYELTHLARNTAAIAGRNPPPGLIAAALASYVYTDARRFDAGDPVRTILNPVNAPVRILRGYRSGSFFGEAYALGTFEYRLPLLDIERGAWTLPFYLRRLHGSVFTDVGDAWMPFQDGP